VELSVVGAGAGAGVGEGVLTGVVDAAVGTNSLQFSFTANTQETLSQVEQQLQDKIFLIQVRGKISSVASIVR
jgi:hypothetical protein